jgi:hypothetical protein
MKDYFKNIFVLVWINPNQSLRYLFLERKNNYYLIILSIGIIIHSFYKDINKINFDKIPNYFPLLLLVNLLIGLILGFIGIIFFGALLSWIGKKIGGKSESNKDILKVFTLMYIPIIYSSVFLIIRIFLNINRILYYNNIINIIMFIFELYGFLIFIICNSEFQKISIIKSIINILISVIIIIVPILIVLMTLYGYQYFTINNMLKSLILK